MNILESKTVESKFLAMLADANVNMQRPDIRQIWSVFKKFAELPVECRAERCNESFLFECGCYNFADGAFTLHFSRNFHIGNEGAAWTEMLDCDFSFKLNGEFEHLNVYVEKLAGDYAHPSQALADFVEVVESKTEIWQAIAMNEPTQVFIGCQGV